MENKTKKAGKVGTVFFCLWVIVAYILAQGVVSLFGVIPLVTSSLAEAGGDVALYQEIYVQKIQNSDLIINLQFVATVVSLLVVAIWYFFGYVKKDAECENMVSFKKSFCTKEAIGFTVLGTIAVYAVAVLIQMASAQVMPNVNEVVNEILGAVIGESSIIGLIFAVILAPIAEELCVRGIVVRRASRAYGLVGCMVISAVMFGILHLNPIQGLYVLPMGLFWGYLAYKFKSVIPSIICHVLNNFMGTVCGNVINAMSAWMFIVVAVVLGAAAFFLGKKVVYVEEGISEEAFVEE